MHPLRPHHVPPSYAAEMADYETDTLVSFQHLYEEDYRLRRRYGIRPRSTRETLRCEINSKKIRRQLTPGGWILWDLEHFLDVFVSMYERNATACSRRSRASVSLCYMVATPAILADPNWQPRSKAAAAAGCKASRIVNWVESMKILPYWDAARRRLLFPVDQLRERAQWRTRRFICRHRGTEQGEKICAAAQKKLIILDHRLHYYLYRVPELAHL